MSPLPRTEHLAVEHAGAVLLVTLDRPDVLNAVNGAMHTELTDLFGALVEPDPSIGAVVLTGRGRGFCAGGDAGWFAVATEADVAGVFAEGGPLIMSLLDIPVPVIAAVNGPAIGLGATIALFCDIVVAAESASFADPHVGMGVVAGDGGSAIWPALAGIAKAKRYLLTGDRITATEAERIGLVSEVVLDDMHRETAMALAQRLAEGPRLAISGTKKTVNIALRALTEKLLEPGLALEHETLLSHDHREAVAAFNERRTPRFEGR